mmetsp:Transcript_2923/g.18362  ORF Transcript_2923/g.18362 Transcript_2923/m.18362 type:complete len:96 (+) Transcript_2923:435-722(+)
MLPIPMRSMIRQSSLTLWERFLARAVHLPLALGVKLMLISLEKTRGGVKLRVTIQPSNKPLVTLHVVVLIAFAAAAATWLIVRPLETEPQGFLSV